jgi:predicted lysophospholipase L1 biosynthesis ABC-type transport system permease subunit
VTASRFVVRLLASAAGVLIGYGMAFAAASVVAAFLPHCGIPCDDTGPEFVAAAAAYGTWLLTASAVSVLAWRSIIRG